ncbi:MAG: hypothetical protein LAT52_08495 [Balneolales bacterium]|nr:hypothetical protein [Balneolales bacterium]
MLYIASLLLAAAVLYYFFRVSAPKQSLGEMLESEADGHPEGTTEALSHVTTILRNQIIATCDDQPLPERAFTNYSLGYINGLLKGALDHAGIEESETAIFGMKYCYQAIFGSEHTYGLIKHTSSLLKHGEDDFTDGVNHGLTEYERYTDGEIKAPIGWIHYVFNRPLPEDDHISANM